MGKNIIILELYSDDGLVRFNHQVNQYEYIFHDWEEPYRSNVRKGDECFVINRTLDTPGIVMHGFIDSDVHYYHHPGSYLSMDRVFLTDLQDINPLKYRLISIELLQSAMPHINWGPGMPGWRITGPYIRIIRRMWKIYIIINGSFKEYRNSRSNVY